MRTISVKLFDFKPVVQEDVTFDDFSYLHVELWRPFCSTEQNH